MLSIAACSRLPEEKQTLVHHMAVFEADGVTCREGCDAESLDDMRVAIAAADPEGVIRWIRDQFEDGTGPRAAAMYMGWPDERIWREWTWTRLQRDEISLRAGEENFHYETKPLWYWVHQSRAYLSRIDWEGREDWRRNVPFLELTVHPFVSGESVMYVHRGRSNAELVLLDLESGRLTDKVMLPAPNWAISSSNSYLEAPYLWRRWVVLPLRTPSPADDGESEIAPTGIVVVELAEGHFDPPV